ncbi:MAG: glycosyltransferase family 2 protein [Deltaproteobacteria bacterium]|nr:glycosyltransferase family 2 protein [Deltaproteobacteria bacterium]MCL5278117.1 glycosyltransferase family 2 protein [Deltaproteobacteria bacterium]
MQTTPKFAVVIPVYNHASTIKAVIESALTLHLPVYVVDDGSTDATPWILKSLGGITVLSHPQNRGKGAAILTGLAVAARTADFAITIDADGQHDPADAIGLLSPLQSGRRALVVGRRENMLNDTTIKWTSRFGRKFSNFWVRLSGGPGLSDTQSGFRIYPIEEILSIRSRARRFQFEVEILVLAHWNGISIVEVPVRVLYPRGEGRISHFRPFVDFWRNAGTFTRLIAMRLALPLSWRRRLTQR